MKIMCYYGLDGQPISDEEWTNMRRGGGDWIVGRTIVGWDPDVSVSTVLLGLDHGFGDGPPLIFETMIFGGEHAGDQWRYGTKEEAERGHLRIVRALFAGIDPDEEEL